MTEAQISKILSERKIYTADYVVSFEKEWTEAVERLRKSNVDLSKIKIGFKVENNGGTE